MEIWCETTKIYFHFLLLLLLFFHSSAHSQEGQPWRVVELLQLGMEWQAGMVEGVRAVTVRKLSFSQRIKFHQCVPIIFIFSIIICENEIWHKMSNSSTNSVSNTAAHNGKLTKPCWVREKREWEENEIPPRGVGV